MHWRGGARLSSPVARRSRCARFSDRGPNRNLLTQPFDLAGTTDTVRCPVIRVLGEGWVARSHIQRLLCRTDKVAVGIVIRPRKKREARSPLSPTSGRQSEARRFLRTATLRIPRRTLNF